MQSPWIAPSILSADFARLGEEVRAVLAAGADIVHFDVMDNHYVPNLTIGPLVCEALRKAGIEAPIDVHLMVKPVDRIVPDFAKAGATWITFHPEASEHVDRTVGLIREQGCRPGIVLNPATPVDWLDYVLDKIDMVLLMSVNPGFGGQSFIPSVLPKITRVREMIDRSGRDIRLEVDGGVKVDNIEAVAAAGADTFVAGSAIFGAKDYAATISAMRERIGRARAQACGCDRPGRRRSILVVLVVFIDRRGLAGVQREWRGCTRLAGHQRRLALESRAHPVDHHGLAAGRQQTLLLEHLEYASCHFARAAHQPRQFLPADLDLRAFRVGHRVWLVAQVHDRVGDPAGDVDESKVAELAVGAVKAAGELGRELEQQRRALRGDLPEARVGHLRKFALRAGAHPGAALRLLVEEAHFAEELALVQVGQHHLVAFLVLDQDFDGALDDVVQHVGHVARVDEHGLRWHRANAAITQETVDRRNLAQGSTAGLHAPFPFDLCKKTFADLIAIDAIAASFQTR
jgi:ribulose-phosphate 3-epimerase